MVSFWAYFRITTWWSIHLKAYEFYFKFEPLLYFELFIVFCKESFYFFMTSYTFLSVVNNSNKKLHLGCLNIFWMRLGWGIWFLQLKFRLDVVLTIRSCFLDISEASCFFTKISTKNKCNFFFFKEATKFIEFSERVLFWKTKTFSRSKNWMNEI